MTLVSQRPFRRLRPALRGLVHVVALAHHARARLREKPGATPFAPRSAPDAVWFPSGHEGSSVNPAVDTFGLEPPADNFYIGHPTEQPSYKMGLNLPWPAASQR